MSYDEEDDFSSSSREALDSPAKAKREALKRKLEKQGQKNDANSSADLKTLKLALLKGQVAGKQDEQTKKDQANAQKSSFNFGTKTREQEIAASTMTADAKPNQDQIVEQGKKEEKAKTEIKKEEVSGEN